MHHSERQKNQKRPTFFDVIRNIFRKREIHGEIELCHGDHEIYFELNFFDPNNTPMIYLNFDEFHQPTCSGIESDKFDVCVVDGGFILNAKIYSNRRRINWIARK